jgi:hypothetical protein
MPTQQQRKPAEEQAEQAETTMISGIERLTETARQATRSSIDAYEELMVRIADREAEAAARAEDAGATWIAPVLNAQAALTRDAAHTLAEYYRAVTQ